MSPVLSGCPLPLQYAPVQGKLCTIPHSLLQPARILGDLPSNLCTIFGRPLSTLVWCSWRRVYALGIVCYSMMMQRRFAVVCFASFFSWSGRRCVLLLLPAWPPGFAVPVCGFDSLEHGFTSVRFAAHCASLWSGLFLLIHVSCKSWRYIFWSLRVVVVSCCCWLSTRGTEQLHLPDRLEESFWCWTPASSRTVPFCSTCTRPSSPACRRHCHCVFLVVPPLVPCCPQVSTCSGKARACRSPMQYAPARCLL